MALPEWITRIPDLRSEQLPEPYRTIAEITSLEAALAIADAYGGDQLYFPFLGRDLLPQRDEMIYDEYRQGAQVRDLARAYDLTVARIYRIIATKDTEHNQINLMDALNMNE